MTHGGTETRVAVACTLGADEIGPRLDEWRRVAAGAVRRLPIEGGVRLELDRGAVADVARLAAAEHECCAFFSFTLTLDERGAGLDVVAPAGARHLVDALLGPPPDQAPPRGG